MCPLCGSENIVTTTAFYFGKDENRATCCDCGWVGIVDDLGENKIKKDIDKDILKDIS